jgi:hypothetical protein
VCTLQLPPAHACRGGIFRDPNFRKHANFNPPVLNPRQTAEISSGNQFLISRGVKSKFDLAQINWNISDAPASSITREEKPTRCGSIGGDPVMALLPQASSGLTTSEAPTLLVYVPRTARRKAIFILETRESEVIDTEFSLPEKAGIVRIPLSALKQGVSLEKDKWYFWYLLIVTDPGNPVDWISVGGLLKRVDRKTIGITESGQPSLQNQSSRYIQAGIWYDAISTVADLRRSQPKNTEYAKQWRNLLHSVGLNQYASQPILDMNQQ